MPVVVVIVAVVVLLLVHVPPVAASCNVTVEPMQTGVFPVIAPGKGFTDIAIVEAQPVLNV